MAINFGETKKDPEKKDPETVEAPPATVAPTAESKAMQVGGGPGTMVRATEMPAELSAAIDAIRNSGIDLDALGAAQDDAMEALTGSAIRMKRIEYARSKKAQEAGLKPGLVTDVLTGEQVESVRARVLSFRRWRRIRPPWDMNADEIEPSICVSLDGNHRGGGGGLGVAKVGDDKVNIGVPVPIGGVCSNCPYSRWQDGRMTCAENYTLLALDRDALDTPFIVTFHGTAIKAFKAAMATLEITGMKAGWTPRLRPIAKQAFATFRMGAKAVSTWFEPVFTDFAGVSAEDFLPTLQATASYAPTIAAFLAMDLDGITLMDVGEGDAEKTATSQPSGPGRVIEQTRVDDETPPPDDEDAPAPKPRSPTADLGTGHPGVSARSFAKKARTTS